MARKRTPDTPPCFMIFGRDMAIIRKQLANFPNGRRRLFDAIMDLKLDGVAPDFGDLSDVENLLVSTLFDMVDDADQENTERYRETKRNRSIGRRVEIAQRENMTRPEFREYMLSCGFAEDEFADKLPLFDFGKKGRRSLGSM